MEILLKNILLGGTWLAQLVMHVTLGLRVVVRSSPTMGVEIIYK